MTVSQWDGLDEHDRAWALALADDEADLAAKAAAVAAKACPACGGTDGACADPDNQHAYVVTLRRCYRTRAVQDALKSHQKDPDVGSLLVSVSLDPTRKKSARAKEARRG